MPPRSSTLRKDATLIFDGDCGFCTSAVQWLERTLPVVPHAVPFQWAPLEQLGVTREEAEERVWLVTSTSSTQGASPQLHQYGGYLAVSAILRHQPHLGWRFLGILMDTPPFSFAAGLGYSLIARFRHRLPGGTPACATRVAR